MLACICNILCTKVWQPIEERRDQDNMIIDTFLDSVMSICLTKTEIIAGSVDGNVRTFDSRIGREISDDLGQPVNCISLSNDSNCVLGSCLDSTLRLLDRATGELLQDYNGHICKNELDYGTDEPPPSPRLPFQQHQQAQTAMLSTQSGVPLSSNAFGPATFGQGLRSVNSDQTKNSVFSNALSSPVRRSLQHYHLSQGGCYSNNTVRSNENSTNQARDPNPPSSNDTSMDMHADSPGHDSPY